MKPARPGNKDGVPLTGPPGKKIETTTHYREQFKKFEVKDRSRSFKVITSYEPPKERMLVESMYQSNFKGKFHFFFLLESGLLLSHDEILNYLLTFSKLKIQFSEQICFTYNFVIMTKHFHQY